MAYSDLHLWLAGGAFSSRWACKDHRRPGKGAEHQREFKPSSSAHEPIQSSKCDTLGTGQSVCSGGSCNGLSWLRLILFPHHWVTHPIKMGLSHAGDNGSSQILWLLWERRSNGEELIMSPINALIFQTVCLALFLQTWREARVWRQHFLLLLGSGGQAAWLGDRPISVLPAASAGPHLKMFLSVRIDFSAKVS